MYDRPNIKNVKIISSKQTPAYHLQTNSISAGPLFQSNFDGIPLKFPTFPHS